MAKKYTDTFCSSGVLFYISYNGLHYQSYVKTVPLHQSKYNATNGSEEGVLYVQAIVSFRLKRLLVSS